MVEFFTSLLDIFVQDLVMSDCLLAEDVCVKAESGDRMPEDLALAPPRVDALTVLLTCIAMGMQVFRYSPTTGEIALAGGLGGVSSSAHPVLGCLLHYSVFANEPNTGFKVSKRHSHALGQENGVWANAVFGRFKYWSYWPDSNTLARKKNASLEIAGMARKQRRKYPCGRCLFHWFR